MKIYNLIKFQLQFMKVFYWLVVMTCFSKMDITTNHIFVLYIIMHNVYHKNKNLTSTWLMLLNLNNPCKSLHSFITFISSTYIITKVINAFIYGFFSWMWCIYNMTSIYLLKKFDIYHVMIHGCETKITRLYIFSLQI